jgi:hypothetical protein
LLSQTYQGGLRGRVVDASSAAVSSARVVLVNQASNLATETAANDQGEYAFPALTPGTYTLSVEQSGFKRFERSGIVVATQSFLTVDIQLQLGDVAQSVQVTGEAPLMETAIPSAGGSLNGQQLADLPNIGRNVFIVLAKAAPNIAPVGDARYSRFQDQSGTSQITIAGGPSYGNNFLVDGIPVTETNNRTMIIPAIEAVQEVKLQANTYDAEMGRTGGGVFNTFLKSGSNDFHGSAFGYLRQPQWAANDFFRNRSGIPRGSQSWKDFGGSFGGPVIVPKIYNGKSRTFFWLSLEGYRQNEGFAQDFALPTAAERTGDFSRSFTRAGALQQIFDPLTTRADDTGKVVRDPFPGNIIPSARINPVGIAAAGYYPIPNKATPFYGAANYSASPLVNNRGDQYTGKLDHEITKWWRASLSYIHYKSQEPGNTWFPTVATPVGTRLNRKTDSTQVNSTFIPGPSTVVDVRWGFNRFPNLYRTVSAGFDPAKLGFAGSWLSDVQYPKFPRFDTGFFAPLGAENDAQWAVYYSRNLGGSVSKLVGHHDLKMGGQYRRIEIVNQPFGYSAGQFGFSDTFTRANYQAFDGVTGSPIASLLLGYPDSGSAQTTAKFFQFVRYYAGYLQDNFRVTPKLTLNLGLRYEWENGLQDENNALIVGFDRNAANPISQTSGYPAKGTLLYAGLNGNPTHVLHSHNHKFAPRIGVAWARSSKMTFRGGYGLYWAPPSYAGFNTLGYTQITQFIGTQDGGRTPVGSLVNPFPNGLLKPVGNAAGTAAGIGQSISFPDQNSGPPLFHQFSFDVQRVLPAQIVLTAGYVGSRSEHFLLGVGTVNLNQLTPQQMSLGSALFTTVDNPFFGKGGTGIIAPARITQAQLLAPYPEFGGVGMTFGDFNHARYDSLAIKAEKRLSKGLVFLSSWTWSKNRDIALGPPNNQNGGAGAPQNIYNLEAEYSLSLLDISHRLTAAVDYELPFGKGRAFLNSNRAVDLVLGGWQVNFLTFWQTGFPLPITQVNQNGIAGESVQRPNATGVSPAPVVQDRITQWMNPAAFSAAPAFTFGNLSRTISTRMPGATNWDFSLFKTFSLYERIKAQFRAEALNLFNTPMFSRPDVTVGSPTFGAITSQRNFPRQLQIGVRMFF